MRKFPTILFSHMTEVLYNTALRVKKRFNFKIYKEAKNWHVEQNASITTAFISVYSHTTIVN